MLLVATGRRQGTNFAFLWKHLFTCRRQKESELSTITFSSSGLSFPSSWILTLSIVLLRSELFEGLFSSTLYHKSSYDTSVATSLVDHVVCLRVYAADHVCFVGQNVVQLLHGTSRGPARHFDCSIIHCFIQSMWANTDSFSTNAGRVLCVEDSTHDLNFFFLRTPCVSRLLCRPF